MTAIHYWSVAETTKRLSCGDVSVQDVTEAQFARIAQINPQINAVTTVVDEALDIARAGQGRQTAGRGAALGRAGDGEDKCRSQGLC